jgi:hypothetical protein
MPDLSFRVESAASVPFAAVPVIAFKLLVDNRIPAETIHTIVLRAQIQIEATRRRYNDRDKQRLLDLFGEPDRWSRTLRTMLWTHADVVVPSFTGATAVDIQVPCTFDFNVGATKYFHGVSDGEIPLNFLFSGTVFYAAGDSPLQVAPISWDTEARFRLPVEVWRAMMDHYYPSATWLALQRDVFERVYEFKMRSGISTWEEAFDRLLQAAEQEKVAR